MVVSIVIDAVAPGVRPTVAVEKVFEYGGRVERLGQANHAFIKQQRPIRMIGNEPVVLETVRVRLPFAKQSSRVLRTPPAGGFLSDTFDILKQAHEAAVTVAISKPRLKQHAGVRSGSSLGESRSRGPRQPFAGEYAGTLASGGDRADLYPPARSRVTRPSD